MNRQKDRHLALVFALGAAFTAAAASPGCRADSSTTGTGADTSGSTTGDGEGGSSVAGGSGGAGGDAVGSGSGGAGGDSVGSGSGGAGGSDPNCNGQDVTVFDVTNAPSAANPVGPLIKVKLTGVIATSLKFFVAKGGATHSCLWGVFVSAPNLANGAEPYSGVLVLSYGDKATEQPAGSNQFFCPKLGDVATGGAIPDDIMPGDELNVIGETNYFLLNQCSSVPGGSTVGQRQIGKACLVKKTGVTVAPPSAAALSMMDVAKLGSPSDKAFHDMWGGVKVKVSGPLSAVTQMVNGAPSVLNQYEELVLEPSNLEITDKVYRRDPIASMNACFDKPHYTLPSPPPFVLSSVEGFNYLNYCTWQVAPNNKCADLNPPSEDCAAGGPNMMPLMCP